VFFNHFWVAKLLLSPKKIVELQVTNQRNQHQHEATLSYLTTEKQKKKWQNVSSDL